MADVTTVDRGALFHQADQWADMDRWHREVARLRHDEPVVYVDGPGYTPFWVLTRHADVFAVSRDNTRWNNTARSVLGPDQDWEQMLASGMPAPASLVQLDGAFHRDHRAITNDWFKPASVRHRQPRIDELADLYVQKLRDFGGRCDFPSGASRSPPAGGSSSATHRPTATKTSSSTRCASTCAGPTPTSS